MQATMYTMVHNTQSLPSQTVSDIKQMYTDLLTKKGSETVKAQDMES